MGLLDLVGGFYLDNVLGGVTAGLDSIGWTQHGRDQYFNRNMQQDFLNQQFDFQREMTANQQDFTREMYNKQWQDNLQKYPMLQQKLSDIAFNNWRNQFNLQNQWNSPQNQVQLALGAGINPNSIYGGSGSTASSSMGASQAAPPPQISPTPFQSHASPIGLPQGFSSPRNMLGEIGSFLRDIGQAKKLGVETDQLEKLFSYEVQERAERIFGQKLTNDAISIANYVNDRVKDTKVRMATQELLKLIADTKNVDADTSYKLQETLESKASELLKLAEKRCKDEEFEVLKFKVEKLPEQFKTEMENLRSMTKANNATAALNNALAKTENEMRDGKIHAQNLGNQLLKIQTDLAQMDYDEKDATFVNRVNAIVEQCRREGIITNNMYEDWQQNKIRTKWADRQQYADYWCKFFNAIGQVLGGVGSASSGLANVRNVSVNELTMRERNEISRETNRIYQQSVDQQPRSAKQRQYDVLGPDWDNQYRSNFGE